MKKLYTIQISEKQRLKVLEALELLNSRDNCCACDGTGDVHSAEGEWRGACDCNVAKKNQGISIDDIHAAWNGAGVDIAGGNWKRFVGMLPIANTKHKANEDISLEDLMDTDDPVDLIGMLRDSIACEDTVNCFIL